MRVIKVNKRDLLGKLKENRQNHEADYRTALEGYRETAIETLEEFLSKVRGGQTVEPYLGLQVPESHLEDYDRAIQMLEWHTEDEIEMTMEQFAQYVQDDWDWKQRWSTSNSGYLAKARSMK
jgi:hypothetical protein